MGITKTISLKVINMDNNKGGKEEMDRDLLRNNEWVSSIINGQVERKPGRGNEDSLNGMK